MRAVIPKLRVRWIFSDAGRREAVASAFVAVLEEVVIDLGLELQRSEVTVSLRGRQIF